jgi:hypothetical protein
MEKLNTRGKSKNYTYLRCDCGRAYSLGGLLAEHHAEQISRAVKRGLKEARHRGKILGRPKNNSESHGRVNSSKGAM